MLLINVLFMIYLSHIQIVGKQHVSVMEWHQCGQKQIKSNFSFYGKSRKHYESHIFLLLWWTSTQLEQQLFAEMDKQHPNCGKTVCFNLRFISMWPEI